MSRLRKQWRDAVAIGMRTSRRGLVVLLSYFASRGFREDAQCFGGLALLAVGLASIYSVGHALAVAGGILVALPLLARAIEAWSYRMMNRGE